MAVAWTMAALQRGKKMPRLNAFLGKFRKRRRLSAVYAPEVMSEERAERLATLTRGLVLDTDTPAYEQPPEEK